MRQPRYLVTEVIRLTPSQLPQWDSIAAKLKLIAGTAEVTLVAEDNLIYVKMERKTIQDPDFIRIKEQLQSMNS
jgi:hypothetical protein